MLSCIGSNSSYILLAFSACMWLGDFEGFLLSFCNVVFSMTRSNNFGKSLRNSEPCRLTNVQGLKDVFLQLPGSFRMFSRTF